MKNLLAYILVIALLGIGGWTQLQSALAATGIDIWTAAAQGNNEAIPRASESWTTRP